MRLEKEMLDAIDQLFSKWAKYDSPGAALAVVDSGEVVYKQGYGMANLEYDIPISPSTVFHVASVSKQFTAMAVALLAHEGRLSLDDDIRDYLPEVHDFGHTITVNHLIHHVSGLRDQWELYVLGGGRMDDVITRENIMKSVERQRELNFEPGTKYLYCNTGYSLLAEIVARVSGERFPEFARKRVFEPLGMNSTHVHDNHEQVVKNRAYSYAPTGDGFKKQVLSYANMGATSLFTTVEDLARWVLNFRHKKVGGDAVVSQLQGRYTLTNGDKIDYAFGLSHGTYRGLDTIGHSGGDAGFRSHVLMFPSEDFAVVVLSNLGTIRPGAIAQQVAGICLVGKLAPEEAETASDETEPVPPDELPGTYRVERTCALVVDESDDGITLSGPEIDAVPLVRHDDGSFSLEPAGYVLNFSRDESGGVRLSVNLRGYPLSAGKVEAPQLTPGDLDEYVGDYVSDELETTYHVVQRNGNLVVRHRRRPDIVLVPIEEDTFAGRDLFIGDVAFERDRDGVVNGLRVSTGRVRNLWFGRC